jgi:spore maturation protein CgeB
VISDRWEGLESFFVPGKEILVAEVAEQVVEQLAVDAAAVGRAARARVLAAHTAAHRAVELEQHVAALAGVHG